MQPEETIRMPSLQLDTLLGRSRTDEEPVFPLVRRRVPLDDLMSVAGLPRRRFSSWTVSIVLAVALVLGAVLLAVLR